MGKYLIDIFPFLLQKKERKINNEELYKALVPKGCNIF